MMARICIKRSAALAWLGQFKDALADLEVAKEKYKDMYSEDEMMYID